MNKEMVNESKMSVANFRQQGFKVRVSHKRNTKVNFFYDKKKFFVEEVLDEKGGETVVKLLSQNGQEVYGQAFCSPKDFYNKKVGVSIALGRAVAQLKAEQEKSELDNWD